jgi:hypothetical protein
VAIFHNDKNETFKDASDTASVRVNGFNLSPMFVDYDHDGDLDLFVTRYNVKNWDRKDSDKRADVLEGNGTEIWRNNGDGTFTNVTSERELGTTGPAYSAIATDYNNDRAVDIVTTIGSEPGADIFENPREGKFRRRSPWAMPFGDLYHRRCRPRLRSRRVDGFGLYFPDPHSLA